MEKIKLIALDLDGTLLDSKKEISPSTVNLLKQIHSSGVKIVLASGRPETSFKKYLSLLDLTGIDDYSISFNGSKIVLNQSLTPIFTKTISYDVIKEGLSLISKLNLGFFAYTLSGLLVTNKITDYVYLEEKITDVKLNETNLANYSNESFIKMTIADSKDKLDLYYNLIKNTFLDYQVFRSHDNFIEILNKESSKGDCLEYLMKKFSIGRNQVISFGDNDNDLKMIQVSKYGFKMKNSSSKQLKKYCFKETEFSNDEEGVYRELINFFQ